MRTIRKHLSFANVMSVLAFAVAVGGTAYAVDGPNPGQNTIGSEDIIGNEVKSDDIGNGRIFNLDIADDIIQSGKIKDDTIASADLQGPPNWTPLNLSNGWTASETAFPAPACYKDLEGIVHLRGAAVRGEGAANPPVTLPSGCSPEHPIEVVGANTNLVNIGTATHVAFISPGSGAYIVDAGMPPPGSKVVFDTITYRGATGDPASEPASDGDARTEPSGG